MKGSDKEFTDLNDEESSNSSDESKEKEKLYDYHVYYIDKMRDEGDFECDVQTPLHPSSEQLMNALLKKRPFLVRTHIKIINSRQFIKNELNAR